MAEDLDVATLYVRGMNTPHEEIEDIWDDTVLNNAYDRALQMANAEVAKRIAMETNSKVKNDDETESVKDKPKIKKGKSSKSAPPKKTATWKAGMPCRAIYEEDGLEYEAFLVKIVSDEDCIVKFLGYDNSERVPISSLKPTLGNEVRMRQVEAALGERPDDGFESQPSESVISNGTISPQPAERPSKKKKKGHKKKNANQATGSDLELPQLQMPNLDMFRNMGNLDMPMPPPPPLASLSGRTDAEEQAISDMLLSWYMTGYYTGLYQGMRRQKQSRRLN